MTSGTAIGLDIPVSIYLISLVYTSITKLKAKGVTLWLLTGLSTGLSTYAIINIFVLVYSKNLIEASPSGLISAYNSYSRMEFANGLAILITLLCSNVVHWVFAMQYWTLALKLELLKNGEDPGKHNTL